MSITEEIIKTALLGTEKYSPQLAEPLQELGASITEVEQDREAVFYKQAYSSLLYEEAGQLPLKVATCFPSCPAETKRVIDPTNKSLLQTILSNKDQVLLDYFSNRCRAHEQVVMPELVPPLLEKARTTKEQAETLVNICGETGRWLCQLNTAWAKLLAEDKSDADWETGTLGQRKQYLIELRENHPTEVIELLKDTFPKENATNRLALLGVLRENLSLTDEDFLISLQKDKSKKVKGLAQQLLQELPNSSINQAYVEWLSEVLVIEKKRKLLKKKISVVIREDHIPDETIFESGIERISAEKSVPDHIYWLVQMLAFVSPQVLADRLQIEVDQLLDLLLAHPQQPQFLPALVESSLRYKVLSWGLKLIKFPQAQIIELLALLTPEERMAYYPKFVSERLVTLLYYLVENDYEVMDKALAINMLFTLKGNPYQLQQPDYQQLALIFPREALSYLHDLCDEVPTNYQHRYFISQVMEMRRIVEIKQQLVWH